MSGMNTNTDHITLWGIHCRPNRLDPFSPLARDVLDVDPLPAVLGWKLDAHFVTRHPEPSKAQITAESAAYASLGLVH